MPIIWTDPQGRQIARPTVDEQLLIRGMSFAGGRTVYGASGAYPTNIAALYFDGPQLQQMVTAKDSVDKVGIFRKTL